MPAPLDFEKAIAELEGKIAGLRHEGSGGGLAVAEEMNRLQDRLDQLLQQTYAKLTPWQTLQVARHPERPRAGDYIHALIDDFVPMAGDRAAAEDRAIVGGIGRFRGRGCAVVGQQRGAGAEAGAAAYRTAARLMRLADRFGLAVLTFVDVAGADTGDDPPRDDPTAAIAEVMATAFGLRVPIVATVIGEGAGTGAVALSCADQVLILEHAVYAAIAPEAAARSLWEDAEESRAAAEALKITAEDVTAQGIADAVVAEPTGGAQRDPAAAIAAVAAAIDTALGDLVAVDGGKLRVRRRERFLALGSSDSL